MAHEANCKFGKFSCPFCKTKIVIGQPMNEHVMKKHNYFTEYEHEFIIITFHNLSIERKSHFFRQSYTFSVNILLVKRACHKKYAKSTMRSLTMKDVSEEK